MAKYSNTVEYNIKTSLDASGLTKLTTQIRQVEASLKTIQSQPLLNTAKINEAVTKINQVQKVLQNSFNSKLGMMDSKALIAGLNGVEGGIKGIYSAFSQGGTQGVKAFNSLYGQISKVDTGLRQVSSTTDKIMNTLGNTVRWGLIASGFASVMNAAHQSVEYVKDLDRSLTNIMMVSGETKDNMNAFARSANEVAQRLGGTTTQMTEATKVFVQQGLSLDQSSKLAEYSVHLANVSEQDSATAADEITAYKNAFKIDLDDLGNAISKWAAVANNAAVSVEELSIASQKAASVAKTVGVDMDQFAGHIAAIEATTREAPENIGNGLKTLYSRISDIKLGETLEDGVNLGQFTGALKKIGVEALDASGQIRDAGAIIEDIMARWKDLSQTERVATATTVAGRFQLARFNALMNSADIYEKALQTSRNETGTETYDRMQETYRDSLEGRSKALTASIEEIFLKAFDTDSFYGLIDAATTLTKVFGDLIEAVGGGGTALTAFSGILLKMFSSGIGAGIGNFISNRQTQSLAASNRENVAGHARAMLLQGGITGANASTNAAVTDIANMNQYRSQMTVEQEQRANQLIEERIALVNQEIDLEKQLEASRAAASAVSTHATGKEIQDTEQLLQYLTQLDLEMTEITTKDLSNAGYGKMIQQAENAQQAMASLETAVNGVIEAERREVISSGELDEAWYNLINHAGKHVSILRSSSQALSLETEQAERLSAVLEVLENAINGDSVDVKRLQEELNAAGIEMREFADNVELAYSGLRATKENVQNLAGALKSVQAGINVNSGLMGGAALGQATQQRATSVAMLTGDIAQLAFAWQSFQSLGSLFADNDMDAGEKLKEIIMNLAMGLPMLIMSLTQLKTSVEGIGFKKMADSLDATATKQKKLAATTISTIAAEKAQQTSLTATSVALKNKALSENTETVAAQKSGLAATAAAAKYSIQGAAASAAAMGVRALGAAMNFMAGPWGIALTVGIMAVSTALSAMSQAAEEAKQKQQELWDEAKTSFDSIKEGQENLEKLYLEYETTGEVSDQFKQSLLDQADALGIANAEMDIALGRYGDLKQKIDEATESQLAYNASLMQDEIKNAEQAFANNDVTLDLQRAAGLSFTTVDETNFTQEGFAYTLEKTVAVESVYEKILAYQQSSQELEQKISDAKKEQYRLSRDSSLTEEEKNQKLTEQYRIIAQLEQTKKQYDEALSNDNAKIILENTNKLIDYQKNRAMSDSDILSARSVEEIEDLLKSGIFGEELSVYLQNLEETEGREAAKAYVAGFVQEMIDSGQGEISDAKLQGYLGNKENQYKESYHSSILDRKESVRENAGFKEDDAFNRYQQSFIELGGAGVIQNEVNTLREHIDATKEDIKTQSDFYEQLEKEKEALKDTNGQIDESSDAYKDWNKRLQEAKKTLGQTENTLDSQEEILEGLTLAAMETNTGLQELSDGWEKWSEALDSGDLNEQSAALAGVQSSVEKILNLDAGSLSADFIKEHLSDITALAEGDLSVLDNLRIAASEDIVQKVILDDQQFNGDVSQLQEYVQEAQNMLPDLEVGATVDDAPFIAGLNAMLQNGQITQEALGDIFEAMGYDVHVDYVPAELPSFEWQAISTGNGIADAVLNGAMGTVASVVGSVVGSQTIQTPRITFTKKGGASSPTIGPSSHKGSGGGGKGGSCFIAGTKVSMLNYYKDIENVKIGDIVLSYNEKTKQNEYSIVLQTMIHDVTEKLYTLYIEDEKLTVTGIHRFLVVHNGKKEWIEASNLCINDLVIFADGTWHKISKINVEIKTTKVYNFEVSNNHNYYVGKNQILAHNKGGGGKGKEDKPKDVAYKEAAEVEKDIYEKINAWLEKLQDDYSKLKKIRDRTWSRDAVKTANQELGLLKSQTKALEQRIKISKEYQKALLGNEKLKKKYNVKDSLDEYGLTDTDLDGIVDNYSEQWDVAKALAEKAQKEADAYFKKYGGETGKDKYGNIIKIKDAQMTEEQANQYEALTKTAENAWKIVSQINEVTKEYEDTANKIRDDEEEQLDLLHEMEDIQIELYQNALKALDTIEEMHDLMAEMKGMWSGFELDSPFRSMVEDVQQIEDFFSGDTKSEIKAYYDNIYAEIDKRDDLSAAEKKHAKDFFQSQANNALSANGYNNLGFGELAAETRKLAELQAMENDEVIRRLVYGTNTKQWEEDFKEQVKKVEEMSLEVEEAWDKALENIIDALDEEADKLDDLYDKYDDVIDRVEREADRISLFRGDDQYDDLSKLADKTGKIQLEKAKKYKQEYDYWEAKQNALKEEEEKERNSRINEANQLIKNASNAQERKEAELALEQAKQYHSDEWEWYDERMRETYENLLEAQDEAAESFKDAYEYAIDEIEAKWLESALGTRDANYLEDDWNRDKDYMTTYKDDFERNYEVQKLNYKWQQMLNDALGSSLATQRKIRNEGQEIVDQLANQVTMSEYDVKLANARLEILQKQIALENAQQNKNQMKLRRDTQGNYKYVYAADKDDVLGKQNDLLDSLYDVWEISKEQNINSTDNYIEVVQQAGERAKEIWNDASLTIEQKQELIAELMADTGRLLDAISEDASDSFNGMISAVVLGAGIGLENVTEMCANVLEALETHNEEAIEAIGVPWDDELASKMEQIDDVKDAFTSAMIDCADANQNFLDEIQDPTTGVAAVTGEQYGSAKQAIDAATISTNDLYNETLKLYTLFGMESKALDEAKKTLEGYKKMLDEATSGSGAFAKQLQAANQSVIDSAKASGNWITAAAPVDVTAQGTKDVNAISVTKVSSHIASGASISGAAAGSGGGGYSGPSGGGNIGGTVAGGYSVVDSNGVNRTLTGYNTADDAYNAALRSGNNNSLIYHNGQIVHGKTSSGKRYATGGYTGSWSDSGVDEKGGKWAILHQKELVLNAADTKNVLAAVELVRQMTEIVKVSSLSDVLSKAGSTTQQTAPFGEGWITQPVNISAEFPNANSVEDIKEALLSLTDAASQYAYRPK